VKTFVALLRGINVGGKNVVRMAELRQTLSGIGLQNVHTYIQSGNIAFQSEAQGIDELAPTIQAAIEHGHGFTPDVLVLTIEELEAAIAGNPFTSGADDQKSIHLYFLTGVPEKGALEKAQALATESETCELVGNVFYLHAPDGIGRSKLAAGVEKALGVRATARNLRSANKVLELAVTVAT
jgi:uncharacterized protein (DUF1697 family)